MPSCSCAVSPSQPEIAEAATNRPRRFEELLRQTRKRQTEEEEVEQQRELERLNVDPFDIEAERWIDEAIRQQTVMENMAHALKYSPENFGRGFSSE